MRRKRAIRVLLTVPHLICTVGINVVMRINARCADRAKALSHPVRDTLVKTGGGGAAAQGVA